MNLNVASNEISEEPRKVDMPTMIVGNKLKKIIGSSEDLHEEIKSKEK